MEALKGKQLRTFLRRSTQAEIHEYWREIIAPRYGYTKLVEPATRWVVAFRHEHQYLEGVVTKAAGGQEAANDQ